jgi:hypothetical protein
MIFLKFLRYWLSSYDFNKLVIKVKMHAKTEIQYDFLRLGHMHENKNIFFLFFQCFDENRVF